MSIPCCKDKTQKHFEKEIVQTNQELESKTYAMLGKIISRQSCQQIFQGMFLENKSV